MSELAPLPRIARVCGNCRFYDEHDSCCHNRPPTLRKVATGNAWPTVAADRGWCGSIQPRADLVKVLRDSGGTRTRKFPKVFADQAEQLTAGTKVYLEAIAPPAVPVTVAEEAEPDHA